MTAALKFLGEATSKGEEGTKMVIAIEDEDGPMGEATVDEFCAANSETFTDEDLADLASLRVQDSLTFGGGACPIVTVTRVS